VIVAFALTIFLSAFLLFQVQLIVAKHLLPWFGGAPAVWTTCQLFFQVSLLIGYSYAHWLTRANNLRRQGRIHIGFLIVAVAALGLVSAWSGIPLHAPRSMMPVLVDQPIALLLLILAVTIGLPFLVLSATGPLLQRWHSHTTHSLDQTYRLFALSNAGSFLGLLTYPFGIERLQDISQQAITWAGLFLIFAICCGVVAVRMMRVVADDCVASAAERRSVGAAAAELQLPPIPARPWTWLLLSFFSSAMFLATTNKLSLEVAAVPFLWVIPLGLYLLTFVICFDRPRWYARRWFIAFAALTTTAVLTIGALKIGISIPNQVIAYSIFLTCFCMVCHGELARLKPGASSLTTFYLVIATGGALGGVFVGLFAPAVFSDIWEFHIVVLAGWLGFAMVWKLDRVSPFYTGDRGLFSVLVLFLGVLAVHFVILWAGLSRAALVVRYDWVVPAVGGGLLACVVSLALWRTRLAARQVWPVALVAFVLLTSGLALNERIGDSKRNSHFAARDFYGVVQIRIATLPNGDLVRQLLDGNTIHGVQHLDRRKSNLPMAYYSPSSGIAAAVRYVTHAERTQEESREGVHFGILGMGAASMAGFARPGDQVRFYELNPTVIEIAAGHEPQFTFVRDCAGEVTVVAGDGRLVLERELREGSPQAFDLLAMDAFSSDAVPVHLLTEEAFAIYASHLRERGSILAFNITNRHLELEPVVAAAARRHGFHGVRIDTDGDSPVVIGSSWILLSRDSSVLDHPLIVESNPRPLGDREVAFTDRYSNLFRVLK
jgi:hypothetical protein